MQLYCNDINYEGGLSLRLYYYYYYYYYYRTLYINVCGLKLYSYFFHTEYDCLSLGELASRTSKRQILLNDTFVYLTEFVFSEVRVFLFNSRSVERYSVRITCFLGLLFCNIYYIVIL